MVHRTRRTNDRYRRLTKKRSLDEAKRNPGLVHRDAVPDFASLHPGYDRLAACQLWSTADLGENGEMGSGETPC